MSTTQSHTEERTDPRDDYIHIGIDQEGGAHCYRTRDERVFWIENGDVAQEFPLCELNRTVNDYIDHVDDRRGWASQELYKTMADSLADSFEE